MTNYGNTGQRYKMSKRTAVEVQGNHVRITLECGHFLDAKPIWSNVQDLAAIMSRHIGRRQRCNECQAQEVSA
jgi:hypothetical protein